MDGGVANLASDSDGRRHWGSEVPHVRWRNRKLRARWQAQPTRSAPGRLKMLAGRESRFARPVNHGFSQQIVHTAKGTGGAIRREELNGIRTRAKVRHAPRGGQHSWAVWQLRPMIAHQAARAGVRVEFVERRHTSRTCSQCGRWDGLETLLPVAAHGTGNLIPAGRSNQQRPGRALVELEPSAAANRTADSPAIPNRREHTLLHPCLLPLQ